MSERDDLFTERLVYARIMFELILDELPANDSSQSMRSSVPRIRQLAWKALARLKEQDTAAPQERGSDE